jgi:ferredoxin-NADP reductase
MFFRHETVSNRKLNAKFNLIRLMSKSKYFTFKTGQFVSVKINKSIFRPYSIASNSEDLPYWNIFTDITPGGPGTTYLKTLKKGGIVRTSKPKGKFLLNRKMDNYVFGATGCGIAPFIPMIKNIIKNRKKKVVLVWGLRFKKDIALVETLNSFHKKSSNFSFEIILSKPNKTWHGKGGYTTPIILERVKLFDYVKTGIYLSGSGKFIKEAIYNLQKVKFPAKKIYFEVCY